MAVYAIGDIQGCLSPLQALVEWINFDNTCDMLWFTGDLVDRGPQSLEVLRFVKELGDRAVVVLGNHDLHLLAVAAGAAKAKSHNTFESILKAADREELLAWLRTRKLLHHDASLGYTLVHAGLLPQWNLDDARRLACEVEQILAEHPEAFFPHMFGDLPEHWNDNLRPPERWRVIANALTRLRYCDGNGRMELRHKGPLDSQPPHLLPWFKIPGRKTRDSKIIFGHWSTIGLYKGKNLIAIDSGCGWGGNLTAVRLDISPIQFYSVSGPKENAVTDMPEFIYHIPDPTHLGADYHLKHI